jgi:hypothetical protein
LSALEQSKKNRLVRNIARKRAMLWLDMVRL